MKSILLNTWLQAFAVLAITSAVLTVQSLPDLKKDVSSWRGTSGDTPSLAPTPSVPGAVQTPISSTSTSNAAISTQGPAIPVTAKHQPEAEPLPKTRAVESRPMASAPANSASRGGIVEFQLAMAYYDGVGVAKDFNRAAELFQVSAAAGNASSMAKIGWMYWFGEGVEPDAKKGAEWFSRGAKADNAEAQYWLATFYEKGYGGLKKDDRQALVMLRRSAAHGYPKAIAALKARGEQVP